MNINPSTVSHGGNHRRSKGKRRYHPSKPGAPGFGIRLGPHTKIKRTAAFLERLSLTIDSKSGGFAAATLPRFFKLRRRSSRISRSIGRQNRLLNIIKF